MTAPIRFAVLGPVRVWRGDDELDAGPRQRRLILALLLVRAAAGNSVSISELVELMWDTDPPLSATNVVHRHVGMLRRVLEPGLGTRATGAFLRRSGSEYRLDIAGGALDLRTFRRLVEQARTGDDRTAVTHYRDALALWHGSCAAGLLPEHRQYAEFCAVDNERISAVRDATEIALRSGQAAQILPALYQATESGPLDEGLHARLMLALGADGRQAEALSAFRDVQQRLAERLGIRPGAELRDAHQRVLLQQHGPAPSSAPSQLPPAHPYFTGRRDELARAEQALAGPQRPAALVIDGMPGVGKTTFAIHLAHRLAPGFPDGRLYVDLRGFDPDDEAMTPTEALRGLLWALGVTEIPAEPHAQAGLYRTVLAGRRVLILLDNCRDGHQIRDLVPGGGNLVVVTTRRRITSLLTTAGAHPMALGPMSRDEARELLTRRVGADRAAAEPGAVDEIVTRCGRLPLALALTAIRAVTHPRTTLAEIARELAGGENQDDLGAVFSWSYRLLSPGAARLFRLFPLHPPLPISPAAATALSGLEPRTAREALAELAAGMLIQPDNGRWTMHDLLRAYATGLGDDQDRPARARLLAFYHRSAHQAHLLLRPQIPAPAPEGTSPLTFTTRHDAAAWFAAEEQNLIAAVRSAAATGHPRTAWQLALTLQNHFQYAGRIGEWATTLETGLAAAHGDPEAEALTRRSLAGACYFLGRHETGLEHLAHARDVFRRLGRPVDEGHVQNNIAEIELDRRRYREAIGHSDTALELFRTAGHRRGEATALMAAGRARLALGETQPAQRLFTEARRRYEEVDDPHGVATAMSRLAQLHLRTGDRRQAVHLLEEATAEFRRAGSPMNTAEALSTLGDLHRAHGDSRAATHAWQSALSELDGSDAPITHRLRDRLGHSPRRSPTGSPL